MAIYDGVSIYDAIKNNYISDSPIFDQFRINGSVLGFNFRAKNFYGNVNIPTGTSEATIDNIYFGDTSISYGYVLIFHGNLTIGAGVNFRPTSNVSGTFIFVKGTLTIENGASISMTARGNSLVAGVALNLAIINSQNQIVPATGSTGGTARLVTKTSSTVGTNETALGQAGTAGSNRGTGGGGSGGAVVTSSTNGDSATSGAGSAGTSWSGGAGGGAITSGNGGNRVAGSASGLTGGAAYASRSTTGSPARSAGGGAGSPAGVGKTTTTGQTVGGDNATHSGQLGAGGLLVVYVLGNITLNGTGSFRSEGSAGGGTGLEATGGSSGGGSVNVFYGGTIPANFVSSGISVVGGTSPTAVDVRSVGGSFVPATGGAGGTGSKNADPLGTANLPKRILLNNGTSLYYYNFASSAWVQATGTGNDPYTTFGMLEGELYALTSTQIATLPSYTASSIKVRVYTP